MATELAGWPLDARALPDVVGQRLCFTLVIGTTMQGTLVDTEWGEDGQPVRLWLETAGDLWSAPWHLIQLVWVDGREE